MRYLLLLSLLLLVFVFERRDSLCMRGTGRAEDALDGLDEHERTFLALALYAAGIRCVRNESAV